MARYALSFTSGGLLAREGSVAVAVYRTVGDWDVARERIRNDNLFQTRTASSSARLSREVVQRLSVLSELELELVSEASPTERGHILWAAACRRYDVLGEYAEEVLRERFLVLAPNIDAPSFDRFLVGKSLWHPELDELKPSTRQKLRQNVFRMLREAGLLSESGLILPVILSERIHETLARRRPSDIRFFPTTLALEIGQ